MEFFNFGKVQSKYKILQVPDDLSEIIGWHKAILVETL